MTNNKALEDSVNKAFSIDEYSRSDDKVDLNDEDEYADIEPTTAEYFKQTGVIEIQDED
ncbi:hypothetical protein WDM69_09765 (plasmid) [Moraxella lincolnii]|uniref:hypothetical protein n=1 Tax=Lwoffella lincolnii TaxID=90241 RepID=UPI0030CB02F0